MGGVSYEDMLNTPIQVIYQDLEFMSIENRVQKMKQDQQQEESKNRNA